MANAGTDSTAEGSVISLPKGGGALSGVGEKFSADLFTGTGNFTVPIDVPAGRHGVQPELALGYSTGNGNGGFGLGWQLGLPGVTRKTSHGLPRYLDGGAQGEDADTFILSGVEDLVAVSGAHPGRLQYRPRTEGLFAWIEHVRDATGDYWEVRSKDGMLTRYGTPRPDGAAADWRDPAVVRDPAADGHDRIFAWRITETRDPFGNLIRYEYARDQGEEPGHVWDQPLLDRITYVDYGNPLNPSFLVSVQFEYEVRPDSFSDYRAGFELRTTLRCQTIRVATHAEDSVTRVVREYRFGYAQAPFNGVSLLASVDVVGLDDGGGQPVEEHLPPLTFSYSGFEPGRRRFQGVKGPGLPVRPLSDPNLALVDLCGTGLPDVVELGAAPRYWSNRGEGRFGLPRSMTEAPPHSLGDPGVQLLDANGDGRADLLVTSGALAGYFPLTFQAGWSDRSFQAYREIPSVSLDDPGLRLLDLDGDGLTDVLHSGTRLRCWFNDPDPDRAWRRTAISRTGGEAGPDVDLSDPRVRLADMTGDGLQDIVLVQSGNIAYWPNLGHGSWGPKVQMRGAPRLPDGHDPRRVLLGDVDGDGVADLVYVDHGEVLLWGSHAGNAWSEQPVRITGTPGVSDADALQLCDLHGTGMAGVLWSRAANGVGRAEMRFLDFTGGVKPYLLEGIDNHLGALTRVEYRPSTHFFLRDYADRATRWRTTLPFPVHVVARVEVSDQISRGTLSTEYRYHHGYWDGAEREFRGFAMVEQLDTEVFDGDGPAPEHYSPPTLTKSWFHVGPVGEEAGDWAELDLSDAYWVGDRQMLARPAGMVESLRSLPRGARRDALRALRGRLLRSELYALDGSAREARPYTVTESLSGVREVPEEHPPDADPERRRIFFSFPLGQRTTQWERGEDPMTQFSFAGGYDKYGLATQQLDVAVPRGRDPRQAANTAAQPYLATYSSTEYARSGDAGHYKVDRVARTTSYEVLNDGRPSVPELRDAVLAGTHTGTGALRVIGHSRTFYDGDAYLGLPLGELGEFGAPVRSESLAFTEDFLDGIFDASDPLAVSPRPPYLDPHGPVAWTDEYPEEFRALVPDLVGYRHYRDGDVPRSPGGYYVVSARRRYDFHDSGRPARGLLLASQDPLGAESRIEYDGHDLLATRTVDAVGLVIQASNDHRMLKPRAVTDANGNTSAVTYSPAGYVSEQYVRGKKGEGDAALPSVRMEYDLLAFEERGQPVSVRSVRRVHHDTQTDVPLEERDEVIAAVEYSDGFGRLLQTRAQAEDALFGDPVFGGAVIPSDQSQPVTATVGRARQPGDPDNVVVSGWQTYDNKGRVVERYEPFFATGWDFLEPVDAELGQKATIFYDPLGRVVRTLNPDGSEQLVVFGVPIDLAEPKLFAPTPWESYSYDANDNAGRTHGSAAEGYRDHWNTPASVEVDALGRGVVSVARNGPDPDADWYVTRSAYDIQGNLTGVTDALGRPAFSYRFDLAQRRWRMDSIDAGRRDTVRDALGEAMEGRDSKRALMLGAFDVLRRPSRVWARDESAGPVTLRQRIEYGDAGDPNQDATERDAARALNLLGRPVAHYDEAGLATVAEVDFKGNLLDTARQLIADAPILAVFDGAPDDAWRVTPFQVDWQPRGQQKPAERAAELLEASAYQTSTSFDALNRVVRQILPRDVEGRRRKLRPRYNRAGGLEQVRLDDEIYVERIAYDAKGQRTLIAYGNGVMTRCVYDAHTFRLKRLRSERYSKLDDLRYQPGGDALQDLAYAYDPAGNILAIRDRAPGSGIPNNPEAFAAGDSELGEALVNANALDRRFAYDPTYRLLLATGRECDPPPGGPPWQDQLRCTDLTRSRAYTERYWYDRMGNMQRLEHRNGAGGFTREFTTETVNNRLRRLEVRLDRYYDYAFDANGNMRAEATSRHFEWNHSDKLKTFRTQTAGAEPSVHAQYLYDAAGQRAKKLVRKQGGEVEVTHYIGSLLEHHRWSGQSQAGENNHVHVTDGHHRVAMVRLGPAHPDDRKPAIQLHLSDHIGSSSIVVDWGGTFVNREEYTPYGDTSFGSFAKKRYRFTGKERDEESGLAYHGARYYAPSLTRWTSTDPGGLAGGLNAYTYVFSNPMCLIDPSGLQPETLTPDPGNPVFLLTPDPDNPDFYQSPKTIDVNGGVQACSDEGRPADSGFFVLDEKARATFGATGLKSFLEEPPPLPPPPPPDYSDDPMMRGLPPPWSWLTEPDDPDSGLPPMRTFLQAAFEVAQSLVGSGAHRALTYPKAPGAAAARLARRFAATAEEAGQLIEGAGAKVTQGFMYHYTHYPPSAFRHGLWAQSSVTSEGGLSAAEAIGRLGLRGETPPTHMIPIVDRGQFRPLAGGIVSNHAYGAGGGTQFTNPRLVPATDLLPAIPVLP